MIIVCTPFHYTIDGVARVHGCLEDHNYINNIKQLPEWHPIVWYEFNIDELAVSLSLTTEAPLLL